MQDARQSSIRVRLELIQKNLIIFDQRIKTCLDVKSAAFSYLQTKLTYINTRFQRINIFLQQDDINAVVEIIVDLKLYFERLIAEIENNQGSFNGIDHSDKKILIQSLTVLEHSCTLAQSLPGAKKPNEKEFLLALAVRKQQLNLVQNAAFKSLLERVNALRTRTNTEVSCFLSYAWKSEDRDYEGWTQDFVRQFATDLQIAGIYPYLDIDNSRYGYNSYEHMNKIDDCHFVIVFGTESLADKHNLGISSVCVELNRIRQRRFQDSRDHKYTVIPIILSGSMETSLPGEYVRYMVVESFIGRSYVETFKGLLARLFQFGSQHREYNDIWENAHRDLGANFKLPEPNEVIEFWKKLQEEMQRQKYILPAASVSSPSVVQPSSISSGLPITISAQPLQPYSPIVGLPFIKNPHFTGRVECFKKIKQSLSSNTDDVCEELISGIGGAGKTQLVVEYAYQAINNREYQCVWFLSEQHIERDFLRLADALGIAQDEKSDVRIVATIQKLNQLRRWLLIFDDVENLDKIKRFFPNRCGHILLTSRNQQLKTQPIMVSVFERMESINYICAFVGKADDVTRREANELAVTLEDIPLALALACTFIHHQKISISKYIQYFMERRRQLWQKEKPPENYHSTLVVSWSMSIEKIKQESTLAAELLNYMVYLSPSNIPVYLLLRFVPGQDDFVFNDAKSVILKYSMVHLNEAGDYLSMHRLCQLMLRDDLSDAGKEANYVKTALLELGKVFPNFNSFLNTVDALTHTGGPVSRQPFINQCRELYPHLETTVSFAKDNHNVFTNLPGCYFNLGMTAYLLGDAITSLLHLENAQRIKENSLQKKEADLEVAKIHHGLCLTYGDLANDNQACWHLEAALVIAKKILGDEHKAVLNLLYVLGVSLPMVGFNETRKGLRYLTQALPLAERIYGEKHIVVCDILRHIGETYRKLGQMPLARHYMSQHMEMMRLLPIPYGLQPPQLSRQVRQSGTDPILRQQRISYLESQLKITEQIHGRNHRLVMMLLHGIATLKLHADDLGQSLNYYEQVKQIALTLQGKECRGYVMALWGIGEACRKLDQLDKAVISYQEFVEIISSIDGPKHPAVGDAYFAIAGIYFDMEEYEQALPHLDKALQIFTEGFGRVHPFIGQILHNMGECYYRLERNNKALGYYRQALAIYQKCYRPHFPPTLDVLVYIGDCYFNINDKKNAFTYYKQVLPYIEQQEDKDRESMLCYRLGGLLVSSELRNPAEALKYYQRAVELDPDDAAYHQDIACCYHFLAVTQNNLGYFQKAEEHFLRSIESDKSAKTCADYANYLYERKRYDEALQLLLSIISPDLQEDEGTLYYAADDQIILPKELKYELDWVEGGVELLASCYACYLAILIYTQNNQTKEAQNIYNTFKEIMENNTNRFDQALFRYSSSRLNRRQDRSIVVEEYEIDDDEKLIQEAIRLSLEENATQRSSLSSAPHATIFSLVPPMTTSNIQPPPPTASTPKSAPPPIPKSP